MDGSHMVESILASCRAVGIVLQPSQAERLHIHMDLMLQWNLRTNLTRITRVEDIFAQHIIDSLAPAPYLPMRGDALDVGTGAGFPGVPLKIYRPELNMTLLDAGRKKVSFLKVLLSRLDLEGIRAVAGRWEDWAKAWSDQGIGYDLITMRAVKIEAAHLSRLAGPLLRPGGVFAWWAGPRGGQEAWRTLAATDVPHLVFQENRLYGIPGIDRPRMLMIWRKETVPG